MDHTNHPGIASEHEDLKNEDLHDDEVDDDFSARVTLQAAIAWITTRSPELTLSLRELKLEPWEVLVAAARLSPVISIKEGWKQLREALATNKIRAWGRKFELPADFELGDPWPGRSERALPSGEVRTMSLVDIRGMALAPQGFLSAGQTWYSKVLVQRDQLELVFPYNAFPDSEETSSRRHKRDTVERIYRELFPTKQSRQGISQPRQFETVISRLKEEGKETVGDKTFKRMLKELKDKESRGSK